MSEIVSRRLSKGNLPDLFVVDGGKGHLLAVKKVMDNIPGTEFSDVVAIAKSDERGPGKTDKIYIPGRKNPLSLRADHPALFLIMRIRDEAHRRAVSYHKKLRNKNLKKSALDQIPGIGSKRKILLFKYFGDIKTLANATLEDLALVPGIGRSVAQNIVNYFKNSL